MIQDFFGRMGRDTDTSLERFQTKIFNFPEPPIEPRDTFEPCWVWPLRPEIKEDVEALDELYETWEE